MQSVLERRHTRKDETLIVWSEQLKGSEDAQWTDRYRASWRKWGGPASSEQQTHSGFIFQLHVDEAQLESAWQNINTLFQQTARFKIKPYDSWSADCYVDDGHSRCLEGENKEIHLSVL